MADYDISGFETRVRRMREAREARKVWNQRAAWAITDAIRSQILERGGTVGVRVTGSQIGDRSGRLRTALTPGGLGSIVAPQTSEKRETLTIGVDPAVVPYSRIHRTGGVIRAKRAKYLTIPMTTEAAATTARNVPGLVPIVVGGKLYLAQVLGNGRLRFWYRLRRSVTIPKRDYLTPGLARFRSGELPTLARDMGRAITSEWYS